MVVDPAFEGAGSESGLTIWRVEKLQIVPVDSRNYGTFYSGDSYIVLHTNKKRGRDEWNIHFWLGSKTSQDEQGVAAIKTIELDDYLGGTPIQHREVQDHESKLFLSYFKNGVKYMEGGVDSGFRHVEADNTRRMWLVKGRRNVRVREVPVSVKVMNHGDSYILDTGSEVFIWIGNKSGRHERLRAIVAGNALRDEMHMGRVPLVILDSEGKSETEVRFFEKIGDGTLSDVGPAGSDPEGEDLAYERDSPIALYKIWSRGEDIVEELVATSDLTRDHLESDNCFLLDAGLYGIFVWVGKYADNVERTHAMVMGQIFLTKKALPKWVTVTRILESGEPQMFTQFFKTWSQPKSYPQLARFAAALPEELEVPENPAKSRAIVKNLGTACAFIPDNGSGEFEMWRIENFELGHVDESTYGIFFAGDCYVIKYRAHYTVPIIYFWTGKESSMDDRAAAALWASNIDQSLGEKSIQVRASQGFEPEHFCRVFKGRMVVLMGSKADGFHHRRGIRSSDSEIPRLFHIRGTTSYNTRAEQVAAVATSLNTDDVFVLETKSRNFVWIGKDSSEEEKDLAHNIVPRLAPGRVTDEVDEGLEPPEFWEALGGSAEYPNGRPELIRPQLDPRFFKIYEHFGRLRLEEVMKFDMEDICEEDVMLLDTGDEIYVWVGDDAPKAEKDGALKFAEQFLNTDRAGRSVDNTPVIIIKQGLEPESFTNLFPMWDPDALIDG